MEPRRSGADTVCLSVRARVLVRVWKRSSGIKLTPLLRLKMEKQAFAAAGEVLVLSSVL